MAPSSSIMIRPLGPMVAAMSRYADQLYQPPKQTIRGITPDAYYSPLQPVAPMAPPNVEPRGMRYQPGQNLNWTPRYDSEYPAAYLKYLSTYPVARIAIENVKDALCKMGGEIQLIKKPGETKKDLMLRSKGDETILRLSRFFEKPDREHMWDEWLRPILEDMLVIDAASIQIRKALSGELAELVRLPGETITRYIDVNGLTPMAPDPGYAQVWYGIPIVNLTTDQLLYKPRNIAPRNTVSSMMYGMSPVEQLVEEIELGFARLQFTLAYYKEGSIPGMLQVVPKGTPSDKITEMLVATNSELAGNFAKRWQLRLIQGLADQSKGEKDQIILTKEQLLADTTFDEKHVRTIFFGIGSSPQRMMKAMNRASSEQTDDSAETEGIAPYVQWLKSSVMDYLIRFKLGYTDYEWVPDPFKEPSFEKMAKALNEIMAKPVVTINESRERIGEEKRPEPEADMLGVVTATGWVPIGLATAQAGAEISPDGKVTIKEPVAAPGEPKPGETVASGKPNGKPVEAVGKPNGAAKPEPEPEPAEKTAHARANFGFGSAVNEPGIVIGKYSEDEPRDEHGRWTSEGATRSGGQLRQSYTSRNGKVIDVIQSGKSDHTTVYEGTERKFDGSGEKAVEFLRENYGITHTVIDRQIHQSGPRLSGGGNPTRQQGKSYLIQAAPVSKASAHDDRRAVIHPGRALPQALLARHRVERVLMNQFKQMHRKTSRLLAKQLGLRKSVMEKYSEDQERDEQGRFAETGANSNAGKSYPLAGKMVDGLEVGSKIPNQDSIAASLDDYEIEKGVREVPMSEFNSNPKELFYAHDDIKQCHYLAGQIEESKRIDPLIVVVDKEGPYVLEGGHRLGALNILGKKSFPALVVKDLSSSTKKIKLGLRKLGNLQKNAEFFKGERADALNELQKAIRDNWKVVADETWQEYESAALAGAAQGALQLRIDDEKLITKINEQASAWARERSAELVGMRRTETGRLVANPEAEWAITDTTRDKLKEIIGNLFETEDATLADIEKQILSTGVFDDARATVIARTEISRAQVLSNLTVWRDSGEVESVSWQLSADHDPGLTCNCEDNAEDSPYPIDAIPEFPDHPNCLCALVLERLKGEEEE